MIYGIRKDIDQQTRAEICEAIATDDPARLQAFIAAGIIKHIEDANATVPYRCVYCYDSLQYMQWYFAHDTRGGRNDCVGQGENLASHGCYVARGDEANHPRTTCNCRSYCHKARQHGCV